MPGRPLRLFLPGALAGMPEALRRAFAPINPQTVLWLHPFVPSGLLVAEILAGGDADVVVSANIRYLDDLRRAGLVPTFRALAGNRLCLIVRPRAAAHVGSLGDLTARGLRVVAPQPQTDPCGQYVAALFAETGMTTAMEEKAACGELVFSRGSGDLPGFLADGRADVGILYASEAQALGSAVHLVRLPPGQDWSDRITFTIGAVSRADPHPHADAFVAMMVSAVGQCPLGDHGFLPPPTAADPRGAL